MELFNSIAQMLCPAQPACTVTIIQAPTCLETAAITVAELLASPAFLVSLVVLHLWTIFGLGCLIARDAVDPMFQDIADHFLALMGAILALASAIYLPLLHALAEFARAVFTQLNLTIRASVGKLHHSTGPKAKATFAHLRNMSQTAAENVHKAATTAYARTFQTAIIHNKIAPTFEAVTNAFAKASQTVHIYAQALAVGATDAAALVMTDGNAEGDENEEGTDEEEEEAWKEASEGMNGNFVLIDKKEQ